MVADSFEELEQIALSSISAIQKASKLSTIFNKMNFANAKTTHPGVNNLDQPKSSNQRGRGRGSRGRGGYHPYFAFPEYYPPHHRGGYNGHQQAFRGGYSNSQTGPDRPGFYQSPAQIAHSNPRGGTNGNVQTPCKQFNFSSNGCNYGDRCRYRHMCITCGGAHAASTNENCRKPKQHQSTSSQLRLEHNPESA